MVELTDGEQAGLDSAVTIARKIERSTKPVRRLTSDPAPVPVPVPKPVDPFQRWDAGRSRVRDRRLAPPKPDEAHLDPRRVRAADAAVLGQGLDP